MPLTSNLKLKDLTLKLTTLIALLTGQRCQTIRQLDLDLIQKLPSKYIFRIGSKLKHTQPGKHQELIELFQFSDKDLCVVEHIREYVSRTEKLRKENSLLLISYVRPHKPVSKDTVTRWVKVVLKRSGIDTTILTVHSSRAAATSYGAHAGVKLDDILKAAGWSSAQTFSKHYHKPIEENNMGTSTMESFDNVAVG